MSKRSTLARQAASPAIAKSMREMVGRYESTAAQTMPALASRTLSDPAADPETGVDLGAGAGVGLITGGEDKGGAEDIDDAVAMAKTI